MSDPTAAFGEALRARRKQLGLTLQQGSERSGSTIGSHHRVETGQRSPTLRTAARYAAAYGTALAKLLGGIA